MSLEMVFEGFVVVGCLVMLVWFGVELERRGVFEKIKNGIRHLFGID